MDNLIEKIRQYKDGEINWLQLAPFLSEAEKENRDMTELPLDHRRCREMIRAYRFLQLQKPEYVENPEPLITARMISSLPRLYSTIKGSSKEEVFEKIRDKVLKGEISSEKLRKIIREYSKGKYVDELEEKEGIVKAISEALHVLDFLIETALKEKSYDELRVELGDQCHNTASRLSCIADEGFLKLWNERRKGYV